MTNHPLSEADLKELEELCERDSFRENELASGGYKVGTVPRNILDGIFADKARTAIPKLIAAYREQQEVIQDLTGIIQGLQELHEGKTRTIKEIEKEVEERRFARTKGGMNAS